MLLVLRLLFCHLISVICDYTLTDLLILFCYHSNVIEVTVQSANQKISCKMSTSAVVISQRLDVCCLFDGIKSLSNLKSQVFKVESKSSL